MISFELTCPSTLETFADRAGSGSGGGRADPKKIAARDGRSSENQRNEFGVWAKLRRPHRGGKLHRQSPPYAAKGNGPPEETLPIRSSGELPRRGQTVQRG